MKTCCWLDEVMIHTLLMTVLGFTYMESKHTAQHVLNVTGHRIPGSRYSLIINKWTNHSSDGQIQHLSSILHLVGVLQWRQVIVLHDDVNKNDIQYILPHLGLTSVYDLDDLQSNVMVRQLLQQFHQKFFPELHFLLLSNYSRAIELLHIVEQFDLDSNRTTDYRHLSYWIVVCSSPCQPSTGTLPQIHHLENVVLVSSDGINNTVLNQLLTSREGRFFSADRCFAGIKDKQAIFPNTRYGLNNRSLIVSTKEDTTEDFKAFSFQTKTGFDGYAFAFLDVIAKTLNFSYTVIQPADGQWGILVNGSWDGLIGQLERREVDMVVAPLSIHNDREKVMDFLYPPIITLTEDIMYQLESADTDSWQIYLKPFQPLVLLTLFLALVLSTLIAYILVWWEDVTLSGVKTLGCGSEIPVRLVDILMYLYGTLLNRGLIINSRNQSKRICLFSWGLFSVIVAACFNAGLVATFAVQKPSLPFTNLDEMVEQKEYKWGFVPGSITEHIFKTSNNGDMYLAWKKIMEFNKTDPEVLDRNTDVHIDKMKREKYAFITYKLTIDRIMSESCDLHQVGQNIIWHQFGIGVPTDYPLIGELENRLSIIGDSGLPNIWWQQWRRSKPNNCIHDTTVSTLVFSDVISVFCLLGVGLGAAVFVLVIELINQRAKI